MAGIPIPLAEALSAKGVSAAEMQGYFGCDVCHSPFEMKNMREAAEVVSMVMEQQGSILVCGDYDADGLTASSILYLYFTDNGVDCDVIIPTRSKGYGLHADMVKQAFEKKFYDLVITVDCGISNRDEVAQITDDLGVEVIVTDHHELPQQLPDCICVNPKLGYPFAGLSGAGVAFKLVQALGGEASRYALLAAIGTIGDIMPMRDENRYIVSLGLQNLNHKSIAKLAELSKCKTPLTANDVAMKIAPKINAAGRVENPDSALSVLLARDKVNSAAVNKLIQLNEQRKQLVEQITAQADEMCDDKDVAAHRLTYLYDENWSTGVLGIAAARYKDKYNFPAAVLTKEGENFVGSARGTDNVDLFDVFCRAQQYLVHFGGHKAAVGFSVAPQNVTALKEKLSEILCELPQQSFDRQRYYDADLQGITPEEAYEFTQKMQPCLPQDKVLFLVRDSVKSAKTFGKGAHLSATLSGGMELKGFRFGKYAPYLNGAYIDAVVSLERDEYTHAVCGMIEDVQILNSLCLDSQYKLNFLRRFTPCSVQPAEASQVIKALSGNSVLAVFDDYETYLEQSEVYPLDDFFVDIFFDGGGSKTVLISPVEADFGRYDKVVCFVRQGTPCLVPDALYVCVDPPNDSLYQLTLNRDICASVYSRIKHKEEFESIKGVYDKYLLGKMSYFQYVAALRVLCELKFIEITDEYTAQTLPSDKKELTQSAVYRCFGE